MAYLRLLLPPIILVSIYVGGRVRTVGAIAILAILALLLVSVLKRFRHAPPHASPPPSLLFRLVQLVLTVAAGLAMLADSRRSEGEGESVVGPMVVFLCAVLVGAYVTAPAAGPVKPAAASASSPGAETSSSLP